MSEELHVEFECACGRIQVDEVLRVLANTREQLAAEQAICDRLAERVRRAYPLVPELLKDYDAARKERPT